MRRSPPPDPTQRVPRASIRRSQSAKASDGKSGGQERLDRRVGSDGVQRGRRRPVGFQNAAPAGEQRYWRPRAVRHDRCRVAPVAYADTCLGSQPTCVMGIFSPDTAHQTHECRAGQRHWLAPYGNGGATTLKVTRVWGEADSQSGHTAVPRSSGGSSATTVLEAGCRAASLRPPRREVRTARAGSSPGLRIDRAADQGDMATPPPRPASVAGAP